MDVLTFETPLGAMALESSGGATLRHGRRGEPLAPSTGSPSSLLEEGRAQLLDYLAQKRRAFDLPLCPQGTAFQRRVWEALCRIPWGETRTYGQLAQSIGAPKAARAVGQANHRNPIPIFIPCHRVIGADGTLTGYAGGLHFKQLLLQLEGIL